MKSDLTATKAGAGDMVPAACLGFEARVLLAFTAAALVVAVIVAATWKLAHDAEDAALLVAHTNEVMVNLARTHADSVQVELSTQSFRITGDAQRLIERDAALAAREATLQRIAELVADNPRQMARLRQVREIVEERKAISRRVEQLRKTEGEAAATAYVAASPLRETQRRLLAELAGMKDGEHRLLAKRTAGHERARRIALASAAFAALTLFMLLAGTHALIRRQLRANEAARRSLAERTAELEQANAELAKASRLKSDFLASMSHELRTPLNAIIGFSELLKDGLAGEMTEKQREYIENVYYSGGHLLSLINDILDLSKVEAGKMELQLEPVSLPSLLEGSLTIVKEKAMAHRIRLSLEIDPEIGEMQTDPRKLKQIVYNYLSNAVKFTPEGGQVALSARLVPVAALPLAAKPGVAAERYLEVAVTDSGIGIAEEDMQRLFHAFVQIDSGLGRKYEGTGLGLSLVKKLAELFGGAVGVQSEPGKGTRFSVWLPWNPNG